MKENDNYGHYKGFVEELKQNPEQTLQVNCRDHGVVWRRLYDWMRCHHISLKRIYQAYRENTPAAGEDTSLGLRRISTVPEEAGQRPFPGTCL